MAESIAFGGLSPVTLSLGRDGQPMADNTLQFCWNH